MGYFGTQFELPRYTWEPDYLKDKRLTMERDAPNPSGVHFDAPTFGGATTGVSLLSLLGAIPGAAVPVLGAIGTIASMIGSRRAQEEEEERRKKQEALQRAAAMSRSFEQAGWGGY